MNLNQKTVRLSRLALFSALILLLNYTPLGYIRVFALEITLIIIPVTLGAMLLGPADGAILGGVFGLTSFATCFGSSQFGAGDQPHRHLHHLCGGPGAGWRSHRPGV